MSNYDKLYIQGGISVCYNVEKGRISEIIPGHLKNEEVIISDHMSFNIPSFIVIGNTILYPTMKTTFKWGEVIYHPNQSPSGELKINVGDSYEKSVKKIIIPEQLKLYDIQGRKYFPTNYAVMGNCSAHDEVRKLMDNKKLCVENYKDDDWQWCHLVAHSMLADADAQKPENLVCANISINGQMLMLEAAIKKMIKIKEIPLHLSVTASCIKNTNFAINIKYQVSTVKGTITKVADQCFFTAYFRYHEDQLSHKKEFDSVRHYLERKYIEHIEFRKSLKK